VFRLFTYRFFLGPNSTRCAHCHSWAQKSLDFQGPPLPMALDGCCPHQNNFVPPHINNRYIISYSILNSLIQCIEAGLKQLTTGRNTDSGIPPSMDVHWVSFSPTVAVWTMDMQGVSPSTASSMNMPGVYGSAYNVSLSTASRMFTLSPPAV
jgi:hypothetical protein